MLRFPKGEAARRYNTLQKLAYLGVVFVLIPLLILTGLTMSPGMDAAWPWLIDIRSGLPFDRYPVFTAHQDSVAMLFLFGAEDDGVPGAGEAIERSLRWNLGANELGAAMVRSEPCPWIYRAIERDERWPRARRYVRTLSPPPGDRAPRLRINRECRSYHLGWVLYAWSDPARRAQLDAIAG